MSTPNYMVYGELGREPLRIQIHKRATAYLCKLPCPHPNSQIPSFMLSYMISKCTHDYAYLWFNHIEEILRTCGTTHVFEYPHIFFQNWITARVVLILEEQCLQTLGRDI